MVANTLTTEFSIGGEASRLLAACDGGANPRPEHRESAMRASGLRRDMERWVTYLPSTEKASSTLPDWPGGALPELTNTTPLTMVGPPRSSEPPAALT